MRYSTIRGALASMREREKGMMATPRLPLGAEDLRLMLRALPRNAVGARDAALLLITFSAGLRRSEAAGLNLGDVEQTADGLRVRLDNGRGVDIAYGPIPEMCPARRLQHWLEVSGIRAGPLFRAIAKGGRVRAGAITPQVVMLVVKRAARRAGLDPAGLAADSLRSARPRSEFWHAF